MSLSTLLEAAKYLDFLDSNSQQQQRQHQQQQHQHQQQPQHHQHHNHHQLIHAESGQPHRAIRKTSKRTRGTRKESSSSVKTLAMSLPTSTAAGPMQLQHATAGGVPIPRGSNTTDYQHASLSSSFNTESPLSSFASTALLCSKASRVTSASSSAASSLSSDSSSCGEILMGDNEFNASDNMGSKIKTLYCSIEDHNNYHLTHRVSNHQNIIHNNNNNSKHAGDVTKNGSQSFGRYMANTSTGPQLVTMTTTTATTKGGGSSGGVHGRSHDEKHPAHLIHLADSSVILGSSIESRHQFSAVNQHQQQTFSISEGFSKSSFGSDNYLSRSPGAPIVMSRAHPMILSSLSPSTQSVMAVQPATGSSPTSSSSSYSRHRELHKTLEKNRRANLRHCFELLKAELPASECGDKKTSHINIIKSAIRYVLALRQQECEMDNELQRLNKIKTELTESLTKHRNNNNNHQQQQQQQQHTLNNLQQESSNLEAGSIQEVKGQAQQQPVAEQQLSFLLSQSKID